MIRRSKKVFIAVIMLIMLFIPTYITQAATKPGTVKLTKITSTDYNKINIKWKKTSGTTNYIVYYRKANSGKWIKLKTLDKSKSSYTHKASNKYPIIVGQKYFYTVKAYNKKTKKSGNYNKKGLSTYTIPQTVKLDNIILNEDGSVTISWLKAGGCDKYIVYTKNKDNTKWLKLETVTGLSYTDKYPFANQENIYSVCGYSSRGVKGKYDPSGIKIYVPENDDNVDVTPEPKPTATPTPMPTATPTPMPTPTPSDIKVSRVRINPYPIGATVSRTHRTYKLNVQVLPDNATNKNVVWTSSDPSIATVSDDGIVTAVGDGSFTITVSAVDGSGKSDSVDMKSQMSLPDDEMNISGGDIKGLELTDFPSLDITDYSKLTIEYQDPNEAIGDITSYVKPTYTYFYFRAYRKGTINVIVKYNGKTIKRWIVHITSDWDVYYNYVAWRRSVENQIWNNNMSAKEKVDAAANYIRTNFTYGNGDQGAGSNKLYAYQDMVCDCWGSTTMLADFAIDLGCQVKYCNFAGVFDSFSEAISNRVNHQWNLILIDGSWIEYDAQPPH